jgi:hypothetical protein
MATVRIVFLSIIFAMLALLPLQMLRPFVTVGALEEKRLPAPPPVLDAHSRPAKSINPWFDDRVGFRPWLVRTSHQIEYSVFGHADKVYIGSDGWLYGREFVDLKVEIERRGEALQDRIRQQVSRVAAYLGKRGVRLIVVDSPSKDTIHPTHLPAEAPRLPPGNQTDRFRSFLAMERDWIFIDGRKILDKCPGHQLFYRHDEHITMPAGFCMAQAVARRVAEDQKREIAFAAKSWTYRTHDQEGGGLANFLSLVATLSEPYEVPPEGWNVGDPTREGSFDRDAAHFWDRKPAAPYEWVYKTHEQFQADKLPITLLYGNSFTDFYLNAGLQSQFKEFYRIRGNNTTPACVFDRIPPGTQYFIWQFLEPYLQVMMVPDVPD